MAESIPTLGQQLRDYRLPLTTYDSKTDDLIARASIVADGYMSISSALDDLVREISDRHRDGLAPVTPSDSAHAIAKDALMRFGVIREKGKDPH